MAASEPATSTSNKYDFKTLLEAHSYISYLKSKKQTNKIQKFLVNGTSSEFEELVFEVNWENARLDLGDCDWNVKNGPKETVKPVYGTCQYEGGVSDMEVMHEGKGKTTAGFSMKWTEGNTFGLGLNSSISLPKEAKELFGESAAVDINSDSFETSRDQEWAFSVKVTVPEGRPIKVDTIVKEETYKGTLLCRARLGGRVSVQIFKRKNHQLLITVTESVAEVLNKLKWEISKIKIGRSIREKQNSIKTRLGAFDNLPEQSSTSYLTWKISGDYCFTKGTNSTVTVQDAAV